MLNIAPPQALHGDTQAQLMQTYRYLFKLSEQLNVALEGVERQAVVLQNSFSGGGSGGDSKNPITAEMDKQYNDLKSLIIKTAHTVRQEMDMIVTELDSKYIAISDWGQYEEEIHRDIVETAESTVESFGYTAAIGELAEQAADFEAYKIETKGFIKRGIIGYDDENFPIIGIAIGQDLKSKTVVIDGVEYEEIDKDKNIAIYTANKLSFWINGVETAYLSNSELVVTRIIVSDSITLGNWKIEVEEKDGITVQRRIGDALDLSGNFTIKAEQINAIADKIDLRTNEYVRIKSAGQISGEALKDIDLSANGTINMIAGRIDEVDAKAGNVNVPTGEEPPDSPSIGALWMNTGAAPPILMRYVGKSSISNGWEAVTDLKTLESAQALMKEDQKNLRDAIEKLAMNLTLKDDGVHIYKDINSNEVMITDKDVQIRVNGNAFTKMQSGSIILGDMRIWAPSSGGLAFGKV